jgi:hypothetical protein
MCLFVVGLFVFLDASVARADAPPVMVPYRLTPTQHVLVRAKINGKGPFNFILDTGAPAMFIPKKVAEATAAKVDRGEWAEFDRFEVEGGLVVPAVKAKVADLFQLEGMNGMGLAGVELHGVIGYNVLARYRIEYDFTRPKLAWTKLDFDPPSVGRLRGRTASGGLEMIGNMMKLFGGMLRVQPESAARPRGFLGAELTESDSRVVVGAVLTGSPAEKAGLKTGDVVKRIGDNEIESIKDVNRRLKSRPEGETISIGANRDGADREVTIKLGKGL